MNKNNLFYQVSLVIEEIATIVDNLPPHAQKFALEYLEDEMKYYSSISKEITRRYQQKLISGGAPKKIKNKNENNNNSDDPDEKARQIASIVQSALTAQQAQVKLTHAQTAGIQAKAEQVQKILGISANTLKWFSLAVGIVGAGLGGSYVSSSIVGNSVYFISRIKDGLVLRIPEWIAGTRPAEYNCIPPVLLKPIADYNTFSLDNVPDLLNINMPGQDVFEPVEYYEAMSNFTDILGGVVNDQFFIQEWPQVQEQLIKQEDQKIEECKKTTAGKLSFGLLCTDTEKKGVLDALTGIGSKMTRGAETKPTFGNFTDNILSFANATSQALKKANRVEEAQELDNMIENFQGPRLFGVEEGQGRFARIRLLNVDGLQGTRDQCPIVLQGKNSDTPLLRSMRKLMMGVCDINILNFAKRAAEISALERQGSLFGFVMKQQKRIANQGIDNLMRAFEQQRNEASNANEIRIFDQMIGALRQMKLKGIKIPEDKFLVWGQAMYQYFAGFIEAGKEVPLLSTKEIEYYKAKETAENNQWVNYYGFLAGAGLASLISSVAYLIIKGALLPYYGAAALSGVAQNIYEKTQQSREVQNLIQDINRQIANGLITAKEGARRKAAIQGDTSNLQLLENIKGVQNASKKKNTLKLENKKKTVEKQAIKNNNNNNNNNNNSNSNTEPAPAPAPAPKVKKQIANAKKPALAKPPLAISNGNATKVEELMNNSKVAAPAKTSKNENKPVPSANVLGEAAKENGEAPNAQTEGGGRKRKTRRALKKNRRTLRKKIY